MPSCISLPKGPSLMYFCATCSRIAELRKENAEYIEGKKKEAQDAITLLADHVAKKREVEVNSHGELSYVASSRRVS